MPFWVIRPSLSVVKVYLAVCAPPVVAVPAVPALGIATVEPVLPLPRSAVKEASAQLPKP